MKNKPVLFLTILLTILTGSLLNALQSQQSPTPASSAEEEQEVIAKGLGAVIGGDEAKAEDDALLNALRNAIEQVVGTVVESEVLVKNYQVVEDNIYSRSKGYVKSYQVIDRRFRSDNTLELTIRAIVKKGTLVNDLEAIGLLISRKGKPRVMVIIDERNMDAHYWWYTGLDMNTTENALMEVLLEKGFPFVDREVASRKIQKDAVLAALNGDQQTAQSIAQESGAEVLIIGTAVAKPSSNAPRVVRESGFVSCQATVNVRVIRADDGSIIATGSQQAAAAHIDQMTGGTQALQKAARLLAQELSDKIVNVWQKEVYSGTTVQLRILNVPAFSDLVKFKNMLKTYVRGVQNIYQREFSGGAALLDVEVQGNANQVAEELSLKDFSPYQITVENVTANSIVITINLKQE